MRLLLIDIETTGSGPGSAIFWISAIIWDPDADGDDESVGGVLGSWDKMLEVPPGTEWDESASTAHGFTSSAQLTDPVSPTAAWSALGKFV